MKQVLTGCVLLLTAGAASAQLMECIDAKGAKTFAQVLSARHGKRK